MSKPDDRKIKYTSLLWDRYMPKDFHDDIVVVDPEKEMASSYPMDMSAGFMDNYDPLLHDDEII